MKENSGVQDVKISTISLNNKSGLFEMKSWKDGFSAIIINELLVKCFHSYNNNILDWTRKLKVYNLYYTLLFFRSFNILPIIFPIVETLNFWCMALNLSEFGSFFLL